MHFSRPANVAPEVRPQSSQVDEFACARRRLRHELLDRPRHVASFDNADKIIFQLSAGSCKNTGCRKWSHSHDDIQPISSPASTAKRLLRANHLSESQVMPLCQSIDARVIRLRTWRFATLTHRRGHLFDLAVAGLAGSVPLTNTLSSVSIKLQHVLE